MTMARTALLLLASLLAVSQAFLAPAQSVRTTSLLSSSATGDEHWQDFLKFDGKPSFDVIEKTEKYVAQPGFKSFNLATIPTDYFDENYVFRGPIIGPLCRKDLVLANQSFKYDVSFPDLDIQTFGFSVDPENPYRVIFFERWKGTNTGDFTLAGIAKPSTNQKSIQPVFPFSIVWTPEGKIIYEHLGPAVDRFEGNTMGNVAAFGLLQTAGLTIPPTSVLAFAQKILRKLGGPTQTFSLDEDIPSWWKSKSRAADANDM